MFYTKNEVNEFLLKGDPNSIDRNRIEISSDYKRLSCFLLRYIDYLYYKDQHPDLKGVSEKYIKIMDGWGNGTKRISFSTKIESEMQKFAKFVTKNFKTLKDHPYLLPTHKMAKLERSQKENDKRTFFDFMDTYEIESEKDPVINIEELQKELLKTCRDGNHKPATLDSEVSYYTGDDNFIAQSIENAVNTVVDFVYNEQPYDPMPRYNDMMKGVLDGNYNNKTGEQIK